MRVADLNFDRIMRPIDRSIDQSIPLRLRTLIAWNAHASSSCSLTQQHPAPQNQNRSPQRPPACPQPSVEAANANACRSWSLGCSSSHSLPSLGPTCCRRLLLRRRCVLCTHIYNMAAACPPRFSFFTFTHNQALARPQHLRRAALATAGEGPKKAPTATRTRRPRTAQPTPHPQAAVTDGKEEMTVVTIHWFRKGLRLHDNPALLEACKCVGPRVYASPVYTDRRPEG